METTTLSLRSMRTLSSATPVTVDSSMTRTPSVFWGLRLTPPNGHGRQPCDSRGLIDINAPEVRDHQIGALLGRDPQLFAGLQPGTRLSRDGIVELGRKAGRSDERGGRGGLADRHDPGAILEDDAEEEPLAMDLRPPRKGDHHICLRVDRGHQRRRHLAIPAA